MWQRAYQPGQIAPHAPWRHMMTNAATTTPVIDAIGRHIKVQANQAAYSQPTGKNWLTTQGPLHLRNDTATNVPRPEISLKANTMWFMLTHHTQPNTPDISSSTTTKGGMRLPSLWGSGAHVLSTMHVHSEENTLTLTMYTTAHACLHKAAVHPACMPPMRHNMLPRAAM